MMPFKIGRDSYGRLVLIGISLLAWLLILVSFKTYGYIETWKVWKVPVLSLPFSDFRLIPGSAESFAKGFEPTLSNPFDPLKRRFNYPLFWRLFFYTPITQSDVTWMCILMIVLFFSGVFLFPGKLTVAGAVGMLLIAFSPASMLLYERGNVDLFVFFICVMILLTQSYSAYVAATLLIFGVIVKLFPFFGISIFLRESKPKIIGLFGVCTLALLFYMYTTPTSVNAAWNLTVRGDRSSYGTLVFFHRYAEAISHALTSWLSASEIGLLLNYGPMAGAIALILIVGLKAISNETLFEVSSDRNIAAFRMGASIYVGTFLFGNNWDYRLAFLILTVPQLFEWICSENKKLRFLALTSTFFVMVSCWYFVISTVLSSDIWEGFWFVFDEACNWMLFTSFIYLLVSSMPGSIKNQISSLLIRSPRKSVPDRKG